MTNGASATKARTGTLGTFAGVFTPSLLTILGIILFLRLGFVVGNAGLRDALIIIAIATILSTLTSISLAAIATNMEVGPGGDYYLISRTLGVSFGGAIGIVLFLAQSVSIAFYAIGFGEALSVIVGFDSSVAAQIIAAVAVLGLFVLAWLGADVASRFQSVVMVLLIVALVSFYVGAIPSFDRSVLADSWASPGSEFGFWALFAIFFPAVTGFTQGVSMSGDLRDPGRSLPMGTFSAVGVSTVVYVSVAILLAGGSPLRALAGDSSAMGSAAAFRPLIDIGVLAATVSSAMASFLGAPRILQSLARDKVFPILNPFAVGVGPANNPRRGVLLALTIALVTISLGDLNVIAPIVSMFFLISYGLLNYATYYEARAQSPSFRPRFRFFHRIVSLAGGVLALAAMVLIKPIAAAVAAAILLAIREYLSRTDRIDRWVDASASHDFQRAKESIQRISLKDSQPTGRNWRPQVLAFSADSERRLRLMRFASWLEGSSGLSSVVRVVQGTGAEKRRERDAIREEMVNEAAAAGIDVHCMAILAPDALEALPIVVQSYGLGALRANTVLFGLPESSDTRSGEGYRTMLAEMRRLGVHVVAVTTDAMRWSSAMDTPPDQRRIDVVWQDSDSGHLALFAAYLFTRTPDWAKASIRIVAMAEDEAAASAVKSALEAFLEQVRITSTTHVIVGDDAASAADTCSDATLVVSPMRIRSHELLDAYGNDLWSNVDRLPLNASFAAASPIDLTAGPEASRHQMIAEADERLTQAQTRLRKLERELVRRSSVFGRFVRNGDNNGVDLEELKRRKLKAEAAVETAHADLEKIRSSHKK